MRRALPALAGALLATACAGTPPPASPAAGEDEAGKAEWEYRDSTEVPEGPGILSGDDGLFTLEDLRR
jgi:hypothetical protein